MIETAPTTSSPFKGKRGLFRAADEAETDIIRLTALVDSIMESWKKHGSESGLSLQVEPRNKKLRWRATIKQFGHQKNLDFHGEEMTEIREGLSDEALTLLIGFEHRRLILNLKLTVARVNLAEHKNYVDLARSLEECAPKSLQSPYISAGLMNGQKA